MDYHLAAVADVAQSLTTSPAGLEAATARQRLTEHGPNQIADAKKKTVWQLLLHQLLDVMILVLLTAAVVSALMGELNSAYVILAIVLVNAVIGFIQEYRAEKALEALKKMAASQAQVLRDGQALQIPAADLVPGDVTVLEAGNIIPADVRFIEAHALKVDESSLTGESANVEKKPAALPAGEYALGDRLNLGYKGTFVTNGRATAYVVATGMNTELGKIAKLIQTDETVTPLQKRLATLGKRLAAAAVAVGLVFFVVGWLRGEPLRDLLLVSISLAIAALPEALPALVTISLALGAKRLVKSHALIRKLPAVETLGSVTYICTDKTGTLTLNKMTVEEIYESPQTALPVFEDGNGLLTAMALNNDVTQGKEDAGTWLGDSTEVALVQYAAGKEHARSALETRFPRVAELPFDSERKCMSTLHQTGQGVLVVVKGALSSLFEQLDASQQADIPDLKRRVNEMAARGYRVLGYAAKLLPALPTDLTPATIESGLTFLGFAGLIDPPRPEARQAVAECKAAGIVSVMITGDHKLTAKAVAESLGIISSTDDVVLTGPELARLDEAAFGGVVEKVRVYARVDPAQKLRIVSALQARHQFVAMTGDGVNDGPALKAAHIGVAMGRRGTEVARQAASLVLVDDDLAGMVTAIAQGRRIYQNFKKAVFYVVSIHIPIVLTVAVPLLAGWKWENLFSPVHIIFLELVMGPTCSIAFENEPAEADQMRQPPRPLTATFLAGAELGRSIVQGLGIAAAVLGVYYFFMQQGAALPVVRTLTFATLVLSNLFLTLVNRSFTQSVFQTLRVPNRILWLMLGLTLALLLTTLLVPPAQRLFGFAPVPLASLGWCALAALAGVGWVEGWKAVRRR